MRGSSPQAASLVRGRPGSPAHAGIARVKTAHPAWATGLPRACGDRRAPVLSLSLPRPRSRCLCAPAQRQRRPATRKRLILRDFQAAACRSTRHTAAYRRPSPALDAPATGRWPACHPHGKGGAPPRGRDADVMRMHDGQPGLELAAAGPCKFICPRKEVISTCRRPAMRLEHRVPLTDLSRATSGAPPGAGPPGPPSAARGGLRVRRPPRFEPPKTVCQTTTDGKAATPQKP